MEIINASAARSAATAFEIVKGNNETAALLRQTLGSRSGIQFSAPLRELANAGNNGATNLIEDGIGNLSIGGGDTGATKPSEARKTPRSK